MNSASQAPSYDPAVHLAALERWLLHEVTARAHELPRPRAAALQVMRLTRTRDVSVETLADALERDAQLTARVLELVNSAAFAPRAPVLSVRHAVVMLGLAALEEVVAEAALHLLLMDAGPLSEAMEAVRRHSLAVAWLSRLVARHTPLETDSAFVAGLLHDVGLMAGVAGLASFLKAGREPGVLTPAQWALLLRLHEALGEAVLRAWGLPEPLVDLAARPSLDAVEKGRQRAAAVLTMAESMAEHAGWGATPRPLDRGEVASAVEAPDSARLERAMAVLNLTPRVMATLFREAAAVLARLEAPALAVGSGLRA